MGDPATALEPAAAHDITADIGVAVRELTRALKERAGDAVLLHALRRLAETEAELRTANRLAAARIEQDRENAIALAMGAAGVLLRAPDPVPEAARRHASHRARRQRPPWLAAAPAVILAAFAAASAGKAPGGHALKLKLTAAGAAAALPLAAGTMQMADTPEITRAPVPAPAAITWSAVPVPSVSPSHRAPGLPDAGGARHYRPRHAAAPPVTEAPVPEPSPTPPPTPGPSPSITPASAAPAGTLVIQQQPGGLRLGSSRTGQVVLFAEGGPVIWSASSADPRVSLDVSHGGLAAGASAVITVNVDPAAAFQPGSAVVTVDGQQVQVAWS